MTNEITMVRAQLALELVEAGLNVQPYVPERWIPPVVIISSGSPYVVPANLSSDYQLNLDLTLVTPAATNQTETEALDALIQETVLALAPINYAFLVDVSKPFIINANNADYLAATLTLNLYFNF